jgi:hypothetical protein
MTPHRCCLGDPFKVKLIFPHRHLSADGIPSANAFVRVKVTYYTPQSHLRSRTSGAGQETKARRANHPPNNHGGYSILLGTYGDLCHD